MKFIVMPTLVSFYFVYSVILNLNCEFDSNFSGRTSTQELVAKNLETGKLQMTQRIKCMDCRIT